MCQVENLSIDSGILSLECVVLHLGNNSEAIPVDATAITISLFDLSFVNNAFYKYVLLVPP